MLSGRALVIVVVSILLGGAYQVAVALLQRNQHISLSQSTRWNIVLNVLVYAVVGILVLSQITPKIKLRWAEGTPLPAALFGAACGLICGGVGIATTSRAEGHLATDPQVVQRLSGGELSHVAITVLLVCIAAPLVEETLFRGLLLEALRPYALGVAIGVSSIFFAVWHFNKTALVYYTLMGCVFGTLYVKRGLAASMSAHACFNGVLVVAAVMIVVGPKHSFDVGSVRFTLPGGWTQEEVTDELAAQLDVAADGHHLVVLDGPEGSSLAMVDFGRINQQFDPGAVAQALRSQLESASPSPGTTFNFDSLRQVSLPTVGPAVEMDLRTHSSPGELVFFGYGGEGYGVYSFTGGSARAHADYDAMLKSIQPVPVLTPGS
jgi:membrane protease YdiL (CAAX protease family)